MWILSSLDVYLFLFFFFFFSFSSVIFFFVDLWVVLSCFLVVVNSVLVIDSKEILRRYAQLSLSEDDGPVTKIGSEIREKRVRKLSLSLLGKIIANKEINREAFKATIQFIWRTVKEVEEIDIGVEGDCLGKFIRVRVMVDVLKPLKRGLRVQLDEGSEDITTVMVCYKRLPTFCYHCGRIEHLTRECSDYKKKAVEDSGLKYGVFR
ncbi:hypothetical protein ACOSP7_025251 [Xanthoceras sorbifolium]